MVAATADGVPPPDSPPSGAAVRRRPQRAWVRPVVSLALLALITAGVLIARTAWLAREVTRIVRAEVAKRTGLVLTFRHVGFSWRHLSVRAEGVELRHPREGPLASVAVLEVRPAFTSLFTRSVKIASIAVDGARVELHFRHGQLVNGPTIQQPAQAQRPDLPFSDLAITDLHVHIVHDQLGTLDIASADVDVHRVSADRVLVGVLAHGGSIRGAPCFDGPIPRLEARAEVTAWRTLRVALAHVDLGPISAHVRSAVVPLDLRGEVSADADLAGPLSAFTCPIPHGPYFHGAVALNVNARFDPTALRPDGHGGLDPLSVRVTASGRVRTRGVAFEIRQPERTYTYSLGDDLDIHFHGDQARLTLDSFEGHWAGAHLVSPGAVPAHPLVLQLGARPRFDGHLDVLGFDLVRLLHDVSITDFAKVLWTLNASVEAHGELWRFAQRPDPHAPAIWFDVAAESRDWKILRDYHQWLPQVAVIGIPRGNVTGQIAIDPDAIRFRHLTALFGRSRADIALVQVRLNQSAHFPDILLEGGHAEDLHLEDIGTIAGVPIAGTGSFTVAGGGPFSDPVITGQGHVRDFHYSGLPLGDYDTRPDRPWRFRGSNVRIDLPLLDARAGRSVFSVRDAYLDFSHWVLTAGAHIASDSFYVQDYYHMFKFEGDPVFEPFTGQTMPRCSPRVLALTAVVRATEPACVDPRDPAAHDARRPAVPPGTDTGHVETDVTFVLGRPGDHPGGVLDVDLTGRDMAVQAFGEPLTHVDAHMHYNWLDRDRGFRGARTSVDYLRARYAGGTVEGSGHVDLGGVMHFVGVLHDVDLPRTELLRGAGVGGVLNGSGVVEGPPEAQRWTVDADVHDFAPAGRNFGDVSVRVRAAPDGVASPDPTARPPRTRWSLAGGALGGIVRLRASVLVPWLATSWRDVDHASHPDWGRDWAGADVQGTLDFTRALDLLPFIPPRFAARLGGGAVARIRLGVVLEHAQLARWRDGDARVIVHEFDLGVAGQSFTLPRGAPFAACFHHRAYWVDPAAATSNAPCAQRPEQLREHPVAIATTTTTATAVPPLPTAFVLGPAGIRIGFSGGGHVDGRLALGIHGEFDLARLAPLLPGISWARGAGTLDVAVTGTSANPRLGGAARLDHAAIGAQALPNPLEDVNLDVRLDGNTIALDRATAQFAAGQIDLTHGVLHFTGRDIDRVDVPVSIRNLAVVPLAGVEVALDAQTRLTWSTNDRLPSFTGDVTLGRVRYTRPVNMSYDLSGNSRVASSDTADAPYDPRNDHVNIDLHVHAREPIRISNNLGEADILVAENERPFTVVGTDQRVGVVGTLTVPRGRLVFRGTDFDIRDGRVLFDSRERIQPDFDVTAQTEIRRGTDVSRNQWRIDLHAHGTPDRFAVDTASDPALSREDIALLLMLRMTRAELDQIAATGNLNAGQGVAVEALATATGLDRTLRQAIPIIDEFRIGSAYSPTVGRTVPQVSVGRRVSDRVRVGATVNTTERQEVRATVDVRVDDHTTLQLGYDNINDQGSSQIGNLGLDLRWRLQF